MNKKWILIFLLICLFSLDVSAGKIKYQLNIPKVDGNCSSSMKPTFGCDYDNKVYVEMVDKKTELSVGDIICFNPDWRYFSGSNIRYICHRIIDIDEKYNTFLTKGDNNKVEDYWIERRDIAIKVVDIK